MPPASAIAKKRAVLRPRRWRNWWGSILAAIGFLWLGCAPLTTNDHIRQMRQELVAVGDRLLKSERYIGFKALLAVKGLILNGDLEQAQRTALRVSSFNNVKVDGLCLTAIAYGKRGQLAQAADCLDSIRASVQLLTSDNADFLKDEALR